MKDNGFSLVELLIVMAIMMIVTGSTISVMGYLDYSNAQHCVNDINSTLDKQRVESMCKLDKPYMYLYKKDGNYYMKVTESTTDTTTNGTKIGNGAITISYSENGIQEVALTATPLKIGYQRSTGAFETGCPKYLKVKNGSRSYVIHLVENTGRHFIE